jgi:tripartite-type tricarboxylate transporter receptor subunit TctC
MRSLITRLLLLLLVLWVGPVAAQDSFPSKPLRLIVPLPPGGPSDALARVVAQGLSAGLGQSVVVDNKPGADGAIALREALAAPADGQTLLYATGSMLALPLLGKPAPFDWSAELAPVGKLGRVAFALMVHPDVPARSVAELVAYGRAQPGRLNYATSTLGELMVAAQFMKASGMQMTRVPYKGSAQAMPDLLGGRVQVMFGPLNQALSAAGQGGLRVLATLLPRRSAALPDVPTLAEAGYAEVAVPTWQSLFVPGKTPAAVTERLAREVAQVMGRPEVQADLERRALFPEPPSASELAATVVREQTMWAGLIAEYKLTTD